MLFFSFFKTLVGKEVAVEMKNDVVLMGTLLSVDQYLNIKLANVSVVDKDNFPQLAAIKNVFVRGSVVRYSARNRGPHASTTLAALTAMCTLRQVRADPRRRRGYGPAARRGAQGEREGQVGCTCGGEKVV